jgi:hypothetical protein
MRPRNSPILISFRRRTKNLSAWCDGLVARGFFASAAIPANTRAGLRRLLPRWERKPGTRRHWSDPIPGRRRSSPTINTPHAIRNLHGFINAIGWKLIYGLNLGTGSPQIAAEEAVYVFNTLGPKVIAFQLCNEPDLFDKNGIRKAGYNYGDFAEEWREYYDVIEKRVPGARFARSRHRLQQRMARVIR